MAASRQGSDYGSAGEGEYDAQAWEAWEEPGSLAVSTDRGAGEGEGEGVSEGGWGVVGGEGGESGGEEGGQEVEQGKEEEEEEEGEEGALRRSLNSAGASLSPSLKHYFIVVNARHKVDTLRRCLAATGAGSAMVFMNFPKRLQDVQHKLEARGVPSAMLHGQMQKMARAGVLNSFRSGKMRVLLLSDVGARG